MYPAQSIDLGPMNTRTPASLIDYQTSYSAPNPAVVDMNGYNYHMVSETPVTDMRSEPSEPMICSICGAGYTGKWSQRNLNRHIEAKHPPAGPTEMTWNCTICGKTYHRNGKLTSVASGCPNT
jgi:hypothetical protein